MLVLVLVSALVRVMVPVLGLVRPHEPDVIDPAKDIRLHIQDNLTI